jgi:23S rRNA (cytosine1962-C5)-methyltransferase
VELSAPGWDDYEVIDSGEWMRLERVGDIVIERQCAQAYWPRTLPESEWRTLRHATHYRPDQGAGDWTYHQKVPERWVIKLPDGLGAEMRLTQFGHIGLFAEQQVQWTWIREQLAEREAPTALNLFAYTGGSTLAAASAGAQVTHVDAVKGIINWARINAERSGLADAPVRWIVEDALKYCQREVRRGKRYDAIILDPPTFGRAPGGAVWKIEDSLNLLLDSCRQLLSDDAAFILLSGHTPGMTAAVMRNVLQPIVAERGGQLVSGDMVQQASRSKCVLPSGVFCRWIP